jgi:hypothetical protein
MRLWLARHVTLNSRDRNTEDVAADSQAVIDRRFGQVR